MVLFVLSSTMSLHAQTQVILTSADTQWTIPTGVTSITVECWGAGGAGGSNNVSKNGAGGGGGGAYTIINNLVVTPDQIYTLNVGAGGAVPGGNGGDTWFNNTSSVLAKGGQGGSDGSNAGAGNGGLGGDAAAGVGDVKFSGGNGGNGVSNKDGYGGGGGSSAGTGSNGNTGGNGVNGSAGAGGTAVTDGGAGGDGGTLGGNGIAGSEPGGAGGGSGESALGGAGADGKMIITYAIGPDCPTSTAVSSTLGPDFCVNDTQSVLTANITTSGGTGTPSLLYQWYYNDILDSNDPTDGNATLIGGATSQTYSPSTALAAVGTRYYFSVGYSIVNCSQTNNDPALASTNTIEISVSEPPTPSDAGIDQTLCTSSTTLEGNNPTAGTGEWFVISGSATVQSPNLYNSAVTALGPGANVLEWRITNGSCPISSTQVTLTNNEPTTPIAGSPQFLCGTSTNLDGNPITEGTGLWTLESGSGNIDTPSSPTSSVNGLGEGDNVFRWTVTNGSCVLFDEVTINSQPVTPATPGGIVGSLEVSPGNLYVYTVAPVQYATSYVWTIPASPGWSISGAQDTNSITIIGGDDGTSGVITVYASNICGDSGTSSTALINSTYLPPHENCDQCHITHGSLGSALTNLSGNANLCLNCHNPVGAALDKPLSNSDKAVPGTASGTSHAWDVPAFNGTLETNPPTDAEMALRIVDNDIVCSTCHNEHNSSLGTPYLRIDNTGDALCKDCHSARDVGIFTADQANHKGSHPVGVAYPTSPDLEVFKSTPTGAVLTPGGNVECSSCHSVHDVTGLNNITTDGYILRETNDVNLCKNCHNYQPHNGMDCLDCHIVHNTDKSNIMMIRNTINSPIAGANTPVVFTSRGTNATPPGLDSGSFAGSAAPYTDGICEVCHDPATSFADVGGPNHAYNTIPDAANGNHYAGEKCTGCHTHKNPLGSFKAPEPGGGGECGSCHPVNGVSGQMTSGSHVLHTGRTDGLYSYMSNTTDPTMCNICHDDYGNYGNDTDALNSAHPEHDNGTVNVVFDPTGLANHFGNDPNASYTGSPGGTCTTYCHSTGTTSTRGVMASGSGADQWGTGPSANSYASPVWGSSTSSQDCNICHPGDGDPTEGAWSPPYLVYASSPPSAGNPASNGHQANAHLTNSEWFTDNDLQPWNGTDYVDGWGTARGISTQCFFCHNADTNHVNSTEGKLQGTYGTQYHLDGYSWFNPFNYDPNNPTTDPLNPPTDGGGIALIGEGTMAPGLNRSSGTHCSSGQSCW